MCIYIYIYVICRIGAKIRSISKLRFIEFRVVDSNIRENHHFQRDISRDGPWHKLQQLDVVAHSEPEDVEGSEHPWQCSHGVERDIQEGGHGWADAVGLPFGMVFDATARQKVVRGPSIVCAWNALRASDLRTPSPYYELRVTRPHKEINKTHRVLLALAPPVLTLFRFQAVAYIIWRARSL